MEQRIARARLGLVGALIALVMLLSALPAAAGDPRVFDPANITWESISTQNITWE